MLDRHDWGAGPGPGSDDQPGAIRLVPARRRVVDAQHPPDLLGDRGKDLVRWRTPGHQRRYPPQRSPARRRMCADRHVPVRWRLRWPPCR